MFSLKTFPHCRWENWECFNTQRHQWLPRDGGQQCRPQVPGGFCHKEAHWSITLLRSREKKQIPSRSHVGAPLRGQPCGENRAGGIAFLHRAVFKLLPFHRAVLIALPPIAKYCHCNFRLIHFKWLSANIFISRIVEQLQLMFSKHFSH